MVEEHLESGWAGSRAAFLVLILAVTLLFTLAPGSRDLWRPNEPVYGLTVKDMFERVCLRHAD